MWAEVLSTKLFISSPSLHNLKILIWRTDIQTVDQASKDPWLTKKDMDQSYLRLIYNFHFSSLSSIITFSFNCQSDFSLFLCDTKKCTGKKFVRKQNLHFLKSTGQWKMGGKVQSLLPSHYLPLISQGQHNKVGGISFWETLIYGYT